MPMVGKRHFPYTKKGRASARKYAKKKRMKIHYMVKPKRYKNGRKAMKALSGRR